MSTDPKANLVFIPFPTISHLVAAVKTANLLADRNQRLSVTVLVLKPPFDTKISSFTKNSLNSRVSFHELPQDETNYSELSRHRKNFMIRFIESQKGPVREAVTRIASGSSTGELAGFVLDMFCTAMIDVANEFGAPSYIFFSCSAATLGLLFRLQRLRDDQREDLKKYVQSDASISVPTYVNPVPARVWPSTISDDDDELLNCTRKFRETNGIIVNTFLELEPHAIAALANDEKLPPVFPVGPILQSGGEGVDQINEKQAEIIRWLDGQPDSSVVFLCFGSGGYFEGDQLREIAKALESSGHRFLWSLRKPPPKEKVEFPGEYENPGEVLPEGFLERSAGIGKVIGWAPQMAVLSHPAVGGFVSHCGWNSTLESVWCGVPVAAWPLYAEQQANAFQLVVEFETAVEIKMDYRRNSEVVVAAETIEKAIQQLMDPNNEIRGKVRAVNQKSRRVLMEGMSSYTYLGLLIDNVMVNVSRQGSGRICCPNLVCSLLAES